MQRQWLTRLTKQPGHEVVIDHDFVNRAFLADGGVRSSSRRARCSAARKRVGQLTPALLAKAFRGELVAQDPADEPASELLARIAATRAATRKARRGRKTAG